jgi:hypothetical protein
MHLEIDFLHPVTGERKTIIGGLTWSEVAEIRTRACCAQHYPLQLNARALARAYQIAPPGFVHRQETFQLQTVN